MTELVRLSRYIIAPFVAFIVARFGLPGEIQGDLTDTLVIGFATYVPWAFSRARDGMSIWKVWEK